ncbi:regucalcin-like [Rhopilema esculentum]|uniref:regucalcin-like n=1 Tax=Rhopilema esculentum TaxID=499914 RepID=UPI0031CE77F8
MEIEVLVNQRYQCGEGPHWDHANNRLIFNDISGKSVTVVDLETKEAKRVDGMPDTVSAVVPRASNKDEVVICHGQNLEILNLETKQREIIAIVDEGTENILNDAKCDPVGRLWAGTMGPEASPGNVDPEKGSVFCLDKDRKISKKFDKVNIANGLAWSLDQKTFYYIDSLPRKVDAFDYDVATGEIKNRRTAIDVKKFEDFAHITDGMCIDEEGMLWIALFNGGKVIRCNPNTGEKLSEILLPVKQTTSCCFAGPNLDQLIVTSASSLSEEELKQQPEAGFVFRIKNVGVRGVQAVSYAG